MFLLVDKFRSVPTIKKFLPLILSLIFVELIYIIIGAIKNSGYHLTYAVTTSMPQGLYLVIPTKKILRYEMAEFMPPSEVLDLIKNQHWIPSKWINDKIRFCCAW